jgi:hypothetical protein
VRNTPVFVFTRLATFVGLVTLSGLVGPASAEEPTAAADMNQGKDAVKEFNLAFAALGNKEIGVEELRKAVTASSDCGVDMRTLIGLGKSASTTDRSPLFDPDKETLPTAAGKLTLNQVQERCKAMEEELRKRKVVSCGIKAVSVQQEKLPRQQWTRLEDFVDTTFRAASCADMPTKHAFPGASKSFEARFKKMCGKGAIYVIDDASWSIWERDGHVYRSYGGTCWEKGVSFGR